MSKRAAVIALLLAVGACDDQVQVEKANSFHTDVRAIVTQARGAGDILLIIEGASTVGSPEAVQRAVRDAMQGRPGSVNPRYALNDADAGQTTSTVHVVLNGPKAITGPDICRGKGAGSNQDNETRVALAFCQSERALSSIKGKAPKATGPDDPKFIELLQTTARELFPAPDRD